MQQHVTESRRFTERAAFAWTGCESGRFMGLVQVAVAEKDYPAKFYQPYADLIRRATAPPDPPTEDPEPVRNP